MISPTTVLKILILVMGMACVVLGGNHAETWVAVGIVAGIVLSAALWSARISGLVSRGAVNPLTGGLAVLVMSLLFIRLTLEPPPTPVPDLWYSQSPKPARFNRALRVEAHVMRVLSPGLYLVHARIHSIEHRPMRSRPRKRYKKRYQKKRPFKGLPKFPTRPRVQAGGWGDPQYRKTRRYFKTRKTSFARKNKARPRRKYFKRFKRFRFRPWRETSRPSSAQAYVFPVLLASPDRMLFPGCRLELRLYGYRAPRKPGTDERSRSFQKYLIRKGASSYLRAGAKNLLSKACTRPDFRTRLRRLIEKTLENSGGLNGTALEAARGIILGDARALNRGFRGKARKLGLLHLFAASGLHLAIFYACLYWPLSRRLGKRRPAAVLLPLPACLGYLWLLDFPVSLSRAFVFVLIFAGKSLVHRRLTITDQLCNAGLVLLLLLPRELAGISGMLSFGAVAGILYFHNTLLDGVFQPANKFLRTCFTQFCVTIAAGLFTTPVLVHAFGAHSHGGPPANVLLVPLIGLVLPLLYAALALSWLPLVSDGLWWAAREGMHAFVFLTNRLSAFGLYYRYESLLNPAVVACGVLVALLIVLRRMNNRDAPARPGSRRTIRLGAVICIALMGPAGAMVMDMIRIMNYFAERHVRFPF